MPKAEGRFYVAKARAARLRKLSPSEFQVFLAIRELGTPTVRELKEFLATLPPLSVMLEKHPEAVLDTSREPPTYNNVNTTLLRMQEAGAVSFLVPEAGGDRRLMTVWPLAETVAHCIHVALRDFLALKAAFPQVLPAIVEEIAARCSAEERPRIESQLHQEITRIFAQVAQEGLPKTHPWTLDRKALSQARKASAQGPGTPGEVMPKRRPGRPRRTTPLPPKKKARASSKRLTLVASSLPAEAAEHPVGALAPEPPVSNTAGDAQSTVPGPDQNFAGASPSPPNPSQETARERGKLPPDRNDGDRE